MNGNNCETRYKYRFDIDIDMGAAIDDKFPPKNRLLKHDIGPILKPSFIGSDFLLSPVPTGCLR
jgi:hypothetical protein